MQVAIVGTGNGGLVAGVCLAELGHEVRAFDRDAAKIARLRRAEPALYEPGLEALCARNLAAGRLSFGTDPSILAEAEIVLLAVGAPIDPETGAADLRPLWAAAVDAAAHMAPRAVLAVKSTVPVGTSRALGARLRALRPDLRIETAANPDFLREGHAAADFLQPDRVVAGADSPRARALLAALYAPLTAQGIPFIAVGPETAEMIKQASNAFLALKTAYVNEIADLCEAVGADVEVVTEAMGRDARIGARHLKPGPGYGGSRLPNAAHALSFAAREVGAPLTLVETAILANDRRKAAMADKIRRAFGGDLNGKTIAILGLGFKAGAEDLSESAALAILPRLQRMGARLIAYDPAVSPESAEAERLPPGLETAPSARAALEGADGAAILTEWPEFAALGPREIAQLLKTPILVDLRNLFSPEAAAAAGLAYESIGRPAAGGALRLEALWREDAAAESRAEERLPAPLPPRPARAAGTAR